LVTAAEPTVGLRFSEGKLKEITGSDPVTARHLYGRHFDFVPQFKLWLSGNHRPTVRDTSEGFWRRICLIPFTVSFKGRADQQLAEKLIAELPGILNWALLGCLEWQRIGLQPPGVVRVATAEYRAEEDLVGTFIAERTTSDPGAVTPFRVLYESYGSWCNDRSESPVSSKAFGEALSEHGFAKARLGGGKSARQGVGLQEV
jgi:putative DNA primase/helicase